MPRQTRRKPILFSGPMVRVLLDGRKTQTRRVLKDQPGDLDKPFMMDDGSWHVTDSRGGNMSPLAVRFRKGDRLWVRETFANDGHGGVRYYATDDVHELRKKKPAIHMPRWASRLTLIVTDVRVQRLQEISEADCIAEGPHEVVNMQGLGGPLDGPMIPDEKQPHVHMAPRTWYRLLWDTINGAGSWDSNPWIVALTFTVTKANIDAARDGCAARLRASHPTP